MSPTSLSITINIGSPLDWRIHRHTALLLRPTNNSSTLMLIQTSGPKGAYMLETLDNHDPATNPALAKEVHVASIEMSKIQLAAVLMQVPVRNADPEFDCQKWVGDALGRLVEVGVIGKEEGERGLEGMVEVIMEAEEGE